jgi:hypothetical protein
MKKLVRFGVLFLAMGLLLVVILALGVMQYFHPATVRGAAYFYNQPGGKDPGGVRGDFGYAKEAMWTTGEKTEFEGKSWVKACWLEYSFPAKPLIQTTTNCGWTESAELKSVDLFHWGYDVLGKYYQYYALSWK